MGFKRTIYSDFQLKIREIYEQFWAESNYGNPDITYKEDAEAYRALIENTRAKIESVVNEAQIYYNNDTDSENKWQFHYVENEAKSAYTVLDRELEYANHWIKELTEEEKNINAYRDLGLELRFDKETGEPYAYNAKGESVPVRMTWQGYIKAPDKAAKNLAAKAGTAVPTTEKATKVATEANKKDVYIDGKHYNSYQEAAEATGISTKTIQRSIDDGKSHKGHTITSTGPETQNYWEQRAAVDQQVIDTNELAAENKITEIQTEAYNKMANELNDFYGKLEDGYTPTRSELVRMEQYQALCSGIQENMDDSAKSSLAVIQGSLEETAATKMTGYDRFSIEAVANTQYNGIYYSDRVWNNTNDAAAKIQEKVTDCIITGESLDKAKQELKELCDNNSYNAMRVLRTETARVQNKAEEAQYRSAGIGDVEILVEPDACDLCSQYKGKTFKIGHQPTLPIHPFAVAIYYL